MNLGHVIKTGAVSGLIYGILQGGVSLLSYIFYREQIIEMIQKSIPSNIPISIEQIVNIGMVMSMPSSAIAGIFVGILTSVIFSLIHRELMGKNSKVKGVFLCVLISVAVIIGEFIQPNVTSGLFMIHTRFPVLAPLSFACFLIFGYLLGMFYDRFRVNHE